MTEPDFAAKPLYVEALTTVADLLRSARAVEQDSSRDVLLRLADAWLALVDRLLKS